MGQEADHQRDAGAHNRRNEVAGWHVDALVSSYLRTHAAAEEVPLDVVQRILGHASSQTTSIYVQTEKQRMLREAAAFYRHPKDEQSGP
jgi:integrase